MAGNVYSILAAYFRYQRDIGVEEIFFDRGSEAGRILAGAVAGKAAVSARARVPAVRGAGDNYGAVSRDSGGGGVSALSKLSKIRTVDALDIKDIRKTPSQAGMAKTAKRAKLAEFYREVLNCGKCGSQGRAKVIFGTGSADVRLFIIGGAPALPDEAAGLPFQAEAGGLLDKILEKMGLDKRGDIFATYFQKCRNSGGDGCDGGNDGDNGGDDGRVGDDADRGGGFSRERASACRPILDKQIDIIGPGALLIFGQAAANLLFENDDGIEQLRAATHTYKGKPAVVTYDLSLMLKDTQYRHGAWDDMKKVLSVIGG